MEFQLAYFKTTVQHFSHYSLETPFKIKDNAYKIKNDNH